MGEANHRFSGPYFVIHKKNNTAIEAHKSLASAFKACSTLNDHEKANRRPPVYLVEVREQPDL